MSAVAVMILVLAALVGLLFVLVTAITLGLIGRLMDIHGRLEIIEVGLRQLEARK